MLTAPGALALLPRAAGCGLAILMWPRRATCSLCARVLPGHAVEGNAALRRLPLPCQLRSREPGLSSRARPPSPVYLPWRPDPPRLGAPPSPLRRSPRCPQVQKQETWGFPAYGMGVGLWIMISSLPRRRLVLNHTCGTYYFSIQGHTVCQGPMHLIYVRLARSSDGDARGSGRAGRGRTREGDATWEPGGAGKPACCPSLNPPLPPWAEPRAPRQPTEGASSSWFCAATNWSLWCWCICQSATRWVPPRPTPSPDTLLSLLSSTG